MAFVGGDHQLGHGWKVESGEAFRTFHWSCQCGETGGTTYRSKLEAADAADAHVRRARASAR